MPRISREQRAQLCSFTYTDGRRCRQPRTSTGEGYCYNHSRKIREQQQLRELLDYILEPLIHNTVSSTTLTFLLVRLYTAVAYGNVPAKTSNALLRIVETLRRTLPDTEHEFRRNFDTGGLRDTICKLYDQHADFLYDYENEPAAVSAASTLGIPSDSSAQPDSSANSQTRPQAPAQLSPSQAKAADLTSSFTLKDVDALVRSVKNHYATR